MADRSFTLEDAGDICLAPFLARERRTEQTRLDPDRSLGGGGVRWSGLGPDPVRPRAPEELRADALAAYERARAFAESPRGRFLLAIRSLQELGWTDRAERARAAFSRGFADAERDRDPAEVGCALAALAPIDHADARLACRALAEILAGPALRFAAE